MAEVLDAIILAGGSGSRMLPASLYSPKETMALLDTPILNHLVLEAAGAGVSRIHIVLSERKFRILEGFFEKGNLGSSEIRPDLPVEVLSLCIDGVEIIPHIQYNPGGVADAISVAIQKISGPFLVLLGDMIFIDNHIGPADLGVDNSSKASWRLVDFFGKEGVPCVGIHIASPEEQHKYGVVNISDNRVASITEKPLVGATEAAPILCGRYLFPGDTSEILEKFPESEFGEMQSIELMNFLITERGLGSVFLDDMQMYDSGDPLTWLKSQVDHAIRRGDIGAEMRYWLRTRMGSLPPEL